jgi:hypothetical protein
MPAQPHAQALLASLRLMLQGFEGDKATWSAPARA